MLPHTADTGFRAEAPDLEGLFEEAAVALARVAADVVADAEATHPQPVALSAPDLPALAFAWLNELIGLVDLRHAALVGTEVERVSTRDGCRLRAMAWFAPYDGERVRPRRQVKSATYHRLAVEPRPRGWTLTAYLDI